MDTKYKTLEHFLSSNTLSINAEADDGWGGKFPIKGIELSGTILFADISGFTQKTNHLSSTETLIFVNLFFAWISGEGLTDGYGIVDKYIGDEIMVVFSERFGSKDSFSDAVRAGRWFCELDEYGFSPHIGIASGLITVGYIGTKERHDCSVFGSPVVLASRCVRVAQPETIVVTDEDWDGRSFDDVFLHEIQRGVPHEKARVDWKIDAPIVKNLKGFGPTNLRILRHDRIDSFMFEVSDDGSLGKNITVVDVVKQNLDYIKKKGHYKPYEPQDCA